MWFSRSCIKHKKHKEFPVSQAYNVQKPVNVFSERSPSSNIDPRVVKLGRTEMERIVSGLSIKYKDVITDKHITISIHVQTRLDLGLSRFSNYVWSKWPESVSRSLKLLVKDPVRLPAATIISVRLSWINQCMAKCIHSSSSASPPVTPTNPVLTTKTQ